MRKHYITFLIARNNPTSTFWRDELHLNNGYWDYTSQINNPTSGSWCYEMELNNPHACGPFNIPAGMR